MGVTLAVVNESGNYFADKVTGSIEIDHAGTLPDARRSERAVGTSRETSLRRQIQRSIAGIVGVMGTCSILFAGRALQRS